MKTAAFITASASAAVLAGVVPHKRELGGVLICNGVNATGPCEYAVYNMEQCYDLPAPFYQNSSTFAVDGDNFYCYPYIMPCGGICTSPTGCTFGAVNFTSPYRYDLGQIGWDKYIASFDCHVYTTTTASKK